MVEPVSRKLADYLVIAAFLTGICLPAAGLVGGFGMTNLLGEKRTAAGLPSWPTGKEQLLGFPVKFEAYFNDHFAFRDQFIRWHNRASVVWLGMTSPMASAEQQRHGIANEALRTLSSKVIPGESGWLFYAGDLVIDDYRCTRPFTSDQLAHLQEQLETRRDWLALRGIHYLVVVAPNKHTIYSEFLPQNVNRVGKASRLDQLVDRLNERTDLNVADLRGALLAAKEEHRTYHRTDTHWNQFGAYMGYREVVRHLARWFPDVRPWPMSDFELRIRHAPGGDLAQVLGLPDLLQEEWIELEPRIARAAQIANQESSAAGPTLITEHQDASLPRAVVLHDSFTTSLWPFLSEHFSHVQYIGTYGFESDAIEAAKPDVVIQEFVERTLQRPLPENPEKVMVAVREMARGTKRR